MAGMILLCAFFAATVPGKAHAAPLFPQCPAVGFDTGCHFLITINPDGTVVVSEDVANAMPYENDEDTMIAVQNNFARAISALPLTSPNVTHGGIFSFDGDGPCGAANSPAATGCSTDPSAYGGPGVFFSNISSAGDSGTVVFNPPLQPGQSAWFALENALVAGQIFVPQADVGIVKTASPNPVIVGQPLTYTMTVSNSGPLTGTNVTVNDPLPANVTFVSAVPSQGSCSGSSTIICTLGSLANGATATITVVVIPTGTGSISNTATVSAAQFNTAINVSTAVVTAIFVVPGAPVLSNVFVGNSQALVTFTPPAIDGGTPITGYTVTSNPAGGVDSNAGSTSLSHLITGLVNGVNYTFTITATNAVGTGPSSPPSVGVTPNTSGIVPGAPTSAHPSVGNHQVTVTFFPPANSGTSPILGYQVTSNPPGGVDTNAGSTGLSHVITGLTNGTLYTFTVTANNLSGLGAPSAPTIAVKPLGPPSAPTVVTAIAGNQQATVSFAPSVDTGGDPSLVYWIYSNPAGGVTASGALTQVVPGLTNGVSYTFTVVARNGLGSSPGSAPSNSVTPTTSPPVCTLTATPNGVIAGGSSTLTAVCVPAALSYTWTNTNFGSAAASGTVSPTATTTYTVVGTNANGSGNPAAATVTVASIQFAPATYSVAESAGNVSLTVSRTGDTSGPATVQYMTCGSGCSSLATAIAGTNFTTSTGTLVFGAGVTSQTINVPLLVDPAIAGSKTFSVFLNNPSGAGIGGVSATVTILDNQSAQLIPVGNVYNIPSPGASDSAYLRFYNLGASTIPVVGTLYAENGAVLGTPSLALTSGLAARGALVLASSDLAARFGVPSWSGRAWMEIKSSVPASTLQVQNLVGATSLSNMSCVSDRFAHNIPAPGNTDQAFVRLYNTGAAGGAVRGTLYDQSGTILGTANSVLVASMAPKSVSVLTAAMIQSATGAPSWTGRAWLDISADFGASLKILNLMLDPSNMQNDMSCAFPLTTVGQLHNIPGPGNADSAYLRFYNSGSAPGTVTGTLYDQNGVVLGTQNTLLSANLPARGVLVLASTDIAAMFGVPSWNGRAWMEVTSSLPSGTLQMQNLVRSSTLTNMSCVSDRLAVNIPAISVNNTDQAFVRLYNIGSTSGAVRGTLYDQSGNILGNANSVLIGSLSGKAVAVMTADQIQTATAAPTWSGRAWLDMTADFGANLKIMNLIRDPTNTLYDMSCMAN